MALWGAALAAPARRARGERRALAGQRGHPPGWSRPRPASRPRARSPPVQRGVGGLAAPVPGGHPLAGRDRHVRPGRPVPARQQLPGRRPDPGRGRAGGAAARPGGRHPAARLAAADRRCRGGAAGRVAATRAPAVATDADPGRPVRGLRRCGTAGPAHAGRCLAGHQRHDPVELPGRRVPGGRARRGQHGDGPAHHPARPRLPRRDAAPAAARAGRWRAAAAGGAGPPGAARGARADRARAARRRRPPHVGDRRAGRDRAVPHSRPPRDRQGRHGGDGRDRARGADRDATVARRPPRRRRRRRACPPARPGQARRAGGRRAGRRPGRGSPKGGYLVEAVLPLATRRDHQDEVPGEQDRRR